MWVNMKSIQLRLLLRLLIVSLIAFSTISFADDDMCDACHDDPSLTQIKGGIPLSIYANTGMISNSVHDGLSCTDCHVELDGVDDFPHEAQLQGVNCAECHDDSFQEYMTGFREHLMNKGFTNIPSCTQCHGNHKIEQADDTDTRAVCGICHNQQREDFET